MTQQFAVASISPRSIAWLIRSDEWRRLETIIRYNCAMLGGYYNVLIPLTEQDTISEVYRRFLIEYDPDLIVLAPDMLAIQPDTILKCLWPFGIVPWENVKDIVTLDPWVEDSNINVTLGRGVTDELKDSHFCVAVTDDTKPDMSRFAFVVCGDVEPATVNWGLADKEFGLYASGHREHYLSKVLKPKYEQRHAGMHFPSWENLNAVPPPSRHMLTNMILDEHQFPLSDAVTILKTCCQMQYEHKSWLSFINLTTHYKNSNYAPERSKLPPAIVILISEHFGIEEAVTFWNLRASDVYVAWLPFSELGEHAEDIARWLDVRTLDGYYGGAFYAMNTGSFSIAFSSDDRDTSRLQTIIDALQPTMQEGLSLCTMSRDELLVYDYMRPPLPRIAQRVTRLC